MNLFPLDPSGFDAEGARLWIMGAVENEDTKDRKMFNDAGELITVLGKWNRAKLASLKQESRPPG